TWSSCSLCSPRRSARSRRCARTSTRFTTATTCWRRPTASCSAARGFQFTTARMRTSCAHSARTGSARGSTQRATTWRTASSGPAADRWVPVRPGDEAQVAQALIRLIADEGFGSEERVAAAQAMATDVDVEAVAAACHLTVEQLATLARTFAEAPRPLALPGASLAGRDNASAAVAAVQALSLIAGTIGQAGGLSLSQGVDDAGLQPVLSSSYADARALVERMQAGEIDVLL